MSEPFIGEIRIFTYNYAPRNWAFCDGQLLPIGQNATLFSIISTLYGGDGRTTFAVPDLKGRVPMHHGRGPGLDTYVIGQKQGASRVPLYPSQMPSHTHGAKAYIKTPESTSPTNMYIGNMIEEGVRGIKEYKETPCTLTEMAEPAISTEGLSQTHDNKQPYLTFSFCIALDGLYPNRN